MIKSNRILIYINDDFFHAYFLNNKKEIIEPLKTKFVVEGEIKNVKEGKIFLEKLDRKKDLYSGLFKPSLIVLYNDITNSDVITLYKLLLEDFNYKSIDFISLSEFLKPMKDFDRLFLYDNGIYTSFSDRKKYKSLELIKFKPIIIGNDHTDFIHYSDKFLIWNNFILSFTKN